MHRIAVVDDNEAWCFIVGHFFRQRGFDVSTFNDSYAFLKQAKRFDVALIDFSIPPRGYQKDTDGPDIINKLKTNLENPPLVILISAYFTEDILKSAKDICPLADAYLSKSAGLESIFNKVKQLLDTQSSRSRFSQTKGHRSTDERVMNANYRVSS